MKNKEEKMITKKKTLLIVCSLIMLFLTVTPLLIICFYTHPSDNDNYVTFQNWKSKSSLEQLPTYFKLGNRYSGSLVVIPFFSSRLPHNITLDNFKNILFRYRLLAFTQILLFSLSLLFFAFVVNKYILHFSHLSFLFLFSLFYYYTVNSSSLLVHTFYEMISASGYTPGFYLSLVLLSLLIIYHFSETRKIVLFIFIPLTLFLQCGTLEIFPIVSGSIILYFFLLSAIKKKKIDFFLFILGCFAACVLLACFFNPFQKEKIDLYAHGGWFEPTSRLSPKELIRYTLEFLLVLKESLKVFLTMKMIPLTICFTIPIAVKLLKEKINLNFWSILPFYCIIFLCGFSFHYCFLSIIGLPRANNIISLLLGVVHIFTLIALEFFFIPFFTPLKSLVKNLFYRVFTLQTKEDCVLEYKKLYNKNKFSLFALMGLFCLTYLVLINVTKQPTLTTTKCWYSLLSGQIQTYSNELDERYETILETDSPVVYVKKLSNPPNGILFYGDTVTSEHWAKFFNKKYIYYQN